MPTTRTTALDQLTADQRRAVSNAAASLRMEGQTLADEHLEVVARYVLGEIDGAECDAQMRETSHQLRRR